MTIVVTGTAGFIGSHVAHRLLDRGDRVIGLDNLNDYYDVTLKQARLERLVGRSGYSHVHLDVADRAGMEGLFESARPDRVIHLAAQAGVRYAAENPHVYVSSNVTGFLHVLEGARRCGVRHLVFASTSSVYGANTKLPFDEHQPTEHPLTLYSATKKANESMAHAYANLHGLPCTGLRFFTVYGPWGRPDMAFFKFTRAILEGRPIPVFNHGNHSRDFTYIDDIVHGVLAALDRPASPDPSWTGLAPDPGTSRAPYRIYNIGGSRPVPLVHAIGLLERAIGRKAEFEMLPLQPGDVPDTAADASDLARDFGCQPKVPVEEGIPRFVAWYREFYGV
jgi:UDP-glucuronate 4-epimerase